MIVSCDETKTPCLSKLVTTKQHKNKAMKYVRRSIVLPSEDCFSYPAICNPHPILWGFLENLEDGFCSWCWVLLNNKIISMELWKLGSAHEREREETSNYASCMQSSIYLFIYLLLFRYCSKLPRQIDSPHFLYHSEGHLFSFLYMTCPGRV